MEFLFLNLAELLISLVAICIPDRSRDRLITAVFGPDPRARAATTPIENDPTSR